MNSRLNLGALVPRGTERGLQRLADLAMRWNARINLLSRRETADDLWNRHIFDSVQLVRWSPASAASWLDLGSGAGFPALVCALVAKVERRGVRFTLVEADGKKIAFLREAARVLELDVTLCHRRIEDLDPIPHDVISARALAPLDALLEYAQPFCHPGSVLLFPKGRQADSELTLARRGWHIRAIRIPSRTDPGATILKLSEVSRRR